VTDRELLELAAKAAGIEIQNAAFSSGPHLAGTLTRWNPLDNDGDALRLAVKLNLVIDSSSSEIEVFAPKHIIQTEWARVSMRASESNTADPYSATRRAIVKAAAEIGRAMK
jgi:hypothetical protein